MSHVTFRLPCAVVLLLALGGCSSLSERLPSIGGLITPYQVDILQGNVVTREQVQALKPGMPREQVRDILGSPLLTSVFHADRWDYVFTLRRQGQEPQRRRVAVFFKGDNMERFEADELPTEAEFVAIMDGLNLPRPKRIDEAVPANLTSGLRHDADGAQLMQPRPAQGAQAGSVVGTTANSGYLSQGDTPISPIWIFYSSCNPPLLRSGRVTF